MIAIINTTLSTPRMLQYFIAEQTFLTFIFPVIQYFIAQQTFLTFIFPVSHNKH